MEWDQFASRVQEVPLRQFFAVFKFCFSYIRSYLFILWLSTWLEQPVRCETLKWDTWEMWRAWADIWTGLVFQGSLRLVKPLLCRAHEWRCLNIYFSCGLRPWISRCKPESSAVMWLCNNFPDRASISWIYCWRTTSLALKPILCFGAECSLNVMQTQT